MQPESNEKYSIFIERLKNSIKHLPGENSHREMAPFRMTTSEVMRTKPTVRLSAVLLLLHFQKDEIHFTLIQRQTYNGTHSGQMSLPGGKYEKTDKSLTKTALRETMEEIGVVSDEIKIIGEMSQVYIPVSKFLIHPFIGYLDHPPLIVKDEREVEKVFQVKIPDLLNQANRIDTKIEIEKGQYLNKVPAFKLNERIVWGATALILNEFKAMIQQDIQK